jgi:ketosteroid isomerase-like protein
MKAVVSLFGLLCACAVLGTAQQPQQSKKATGEEGRIIALESAWDQAEQNKDAAALANLLADNIVYVDYDGSISTKQQFLAEVKSADVTGEQINNEGVTVHMHANNVAVSTGIYRDKGMEKGKPFLRRGRFTNVWINQNGKWECIASQSTLIAH